MIQLCSRKHSSECIFEQMSDVTPIQTQSVEGVREMPQERAQLRTVDEIGDVPTPQVEEIVKVVPIFPQDDITESLVEPIFADEVDTT